MQATGTPTPSPAHRIRWTSSYQTPVDESFGNVGAVITAGGAHKRLDAYGLLETFNAYPRDVIAMARAKMGPYNSDAYGVFKRSSDEPAGLAVKALGHPIRNEEGLVTGYDSPQVTRGTQLLVRDGQMVAVFTRDAAVVSDAGGTAKLGVHTNDIATLG